MAQRKAAARIGHVLQLAVIRGSQLSEEACKDYCIRLSQLLLQAYTLL